jgi:hypothetical protein
MPVGGRTPGLLAGVFHYLSRNMLSWFALAYSRNSCCIRIRLILWLEKTNDLDLVGEALTRSSVSVFWAKPLKPGSDQIVGRLILNPSWDPMSELDTYQAGFQEMHSYVRCPFKHGGRDWIPRCHLCVTNLQSMRWILILVGMDVYDDCIIFSCRLMAILRSRGPVIGVGFVAASRSEFSPDK